MCDLNCGNLIDLNLEEDVDRSNMQRKTDGKLAADTPDFIPPTWRKRDSLGNNPFDRAQKLADRLDDPFDIVEKEACLKAHRACKKLGEVKLGNLLSLSDDNLLKEEKNPATPLVSEICKIDSKVEELDLESPPILFNEKHNTDSMSGSETGSTPNSSSETSTSVKLKRNMEYRKRLLKLSISNAAFTAPIIYEPNSDIGDILATPVSSMLFRAAEFGENLLASESPLKLVEDKDLTLEYPTNFADSETNFEADLEMLKIPMLNDLLSPPVDQITIKSDDDCTQFVNTSDCLKNELTNLKDIKAKLKAKKDEISTNHEMEISVLIQNLKSLISSGEVIDKNKKQQAHYLLETLSSTLKQSNVKEVLETSELLEVSAKPIKREGTFDMDLQRKPASNNENQPSAQEMPNCMVSSSATYDGESSNEKQNLNLPEISPLSPQAVHSKKCYLENNINNCTDHMQADVNDVMEQLSKLLINNSAENPGNCNNPTFIVVMNANPLNQSNTNSFASYLENSINDGSPDLTKFDPISRRRSQSLSIHDKIKVVHLPIQPTTPRYKENQNSVKMDEPSSITTTPPSGDKETSEFKTPARFRCNSYSSGTPYTAQVGVRRTGICSENRNLTKMRRTQNLDTHHEGRHHQAIVRPMSISSNNLLTFKPDLKKKSKLNTESIIKSSGPLKATIPVKKVAPMLKTSAATPEKVIKTKIILPRTPLPGKGSSRLGENVGYPNASSTPSAFSSPLRRTNGPVNKQRYSCMSTIISPKSSLNNSSSSLGLKRRTITEFKAKSPLKPRVSSVGLVPGGSGSSSRSAGTSRLSISAGARICKTPVKTTNANAVSIKPSSRLGYRASITGSVMSARNKENKRPS